MVQEDADDDACANIGNLFDESAIEGTPAVTVSDLGVADEADNDGNCLVLMQLTPLLFVFNQARCSTCASFKTKRLHIAWLECVSMLSTFHHHCITRKPVSTCSSSPSPDFFIGTIPFDTSCCTNGCD